MRKFLFITISALLGAASSAHANEVTGVTCPAGYNVVISNGEKTLVCEKTEVITLGSHCGIGSMDSAGSDTCLPVGAGNRRPSGIFGWIPGVHPPIEKFQRVVIANGPDKFTANKKVYAYPEGAVYVGVDASKGVTCPSGFDGDKRDDLRGIRCDKVLANNVAADCDLGWTLREDDQGRDQDKCIGANGVGPTKPRGITKVQFDIEDDLSHIKWHLSKNNGPDKWKKKEYAFPKTN